MDWVPGHDRWGTAVMHVGFAKRTCRVCPSRPLCTRAKTALREMTFRQPGRHEAIQAARQRQDTPEWQALYGVRAGIEGCLSQGIRVCGLRRSRYVGLAKTHLQQSRPRRLSTPCAWTPGCAAHQELPRAPHASSVSWPLERAADFANGIGCASDPGIELPALSIRA